MAAFREQFTAFIGANLAPEARSRILARAARDMLAELQHQGRAGAQYTRFVDGRAGMAEEQVRGTGGGEIRYEFAYVGEAAAWALEFLFRRSPARSGEFRNAFWIGVNGRFMPARSFGKALCPADAEVIITNPEPQTRKIDVQLAGGEQLRFSVPAGLFDDAARAVRRQFPVAARRVGNVRFAGQYLLRKGRARGERVQSPALILNPLQ